LLPTDKKLWLRIKFLIQSFLLEKTNGETEQTKFVLDTKETEQTKFVLDTKETEQTKFVLDSFAALVYTHGYKLR